MSVAVELDEEKNLIKITAGWRYKELCKSIPGTTWKAKEDAWTMPVSWSGCLALRSTFKDDLEIGPKLAAWAFNELDTRINPANALRDVVELPEKVRNTDLYEHQQAGVQFLANAQQALLADEPGLGKTAQAIRTLAELYQRGEEVFPALIVCPNTLKSNWEREFDQWWPGVNVQVIRRHSHSEA